VRRTVATLARRARPRGALSLIEVTVCVAVVGVMMTAALSALYGVARTRKSDSDKQIARTLAELLMAEILSKEYQDPLAMAYSLGPESDELETGNRTLFDDVDDYNGWSESTVQWPDGVTIPNRDGWTRSVEVACVSPAAFDQVQPSGWDLGLKRITVHVMYDGNEVYTLTAIRGRTKDYPWP
jgi:type II secretory pathway pseudopilin PulG